MRGRDIALLGRIPIEIVQLLDAFAQIEDVLPAAFTNPKPEAILGHVEIRAGRALRVEQAAPLPIGPGWQSREVHDGGRQIDVAADGLRAQRGLIRAREPEQQGHVNVLLVHRVALRVGIVRIPERLPMIARDDNERVLVEARAADGLEEPFEMTIRFVQDVQIAVEVVVVRRRLAQELEHRDAGRRFVRMMRLRGPPHQKNGRAPAPDR